MGKTSRKYKRRDDIAPTVARIHRVSTRYVQMVRDGDRDDDEIMNTLVEYTQGKNKLIRALEEMIAVTPNPKRYAGEKN